jgi:SIR2-like domain
MAYLFDCEAEAKTISKRLARSFQSGTINFLLGSGASMPAIPVAGTTEQAIGNLFTVGEDVQARLRMYEFLIGIQVPMNKLIADQPDEHNAATVAQYQRFLSLVEAILFERRTTLLTKQATIFTTNYDLFIEKASINNPTLVLNDGFSRVPSLDNRIEYSSRTFFNSTYNTGNLYNYKVEIPSVNLIKLHGSFSWKKDHTKIVFRVALKTLLPTERTSEEIQQYTDDYAVVLPQMTKFRTTLMDSTYYELLRIYANTLDRENAVLVAFGFSFADAHILDITARALKNPTLRLVVFAFDETAQTQYAATFAGHNNVDIVRPPAGGTIDFTRFNSIIAGVLPQLTEP